jgi:chromosome segregation ATPase
MSADGGSMDDGRWMTFTELAAFRGIDRQSARRLASRQKWRRQKDNQLVVRVYVPLTLAERRVVSADMSADRSADTSAIMSADMSAVIGPLEAAISTLREQLERANDRAEADRAAIAQADGRANRAEAGREAAETNAAALRERLEAMQVQLAEAHAALQAAAAADARADRAEQGRDGERARADALRERIGTMQAEAATLQAQLAKSEAEGNALTIETAELTAQVKAAKAEAREAQDREEELRQADAARRGRGRLARLRAAWSGAE